MKILANMDRKVSADIIQCQHKPQEKNPMEPLYFDYNATTPVHETVVSEMLPFFTDKFGNPGCAHMHGLEAAKAAELARLQTASLIGAEPAQLFFTSCATESNNLVLSGLLKPGEELIVSAIEHPSIIRPALELEKAGIAVKVAPVNHEGLIDAGQVIDLVSDRTRLVSIMLANNETGVIQPVAELAPLLKLRNISLHTDASQAVGKIKVDVKSLGVDFLTVAGHKMYAPKGVGALFVRNPGVLKPLLYGGGQEKGLKPGTENIPFIAGLGRAADLASVDIEEEGRRQKELGRFFLKGISEICPDSTLHSANGPRLPGTMAIGFGGYRAGDILSGLVACNVSASAGAACHGSIQKMSSVLEAMGTAPYYGEGTIRFSWGRMTAMDHVNELLNRLEYIFHGFLQHQYR